MNEATGPGGSKENEGSALPSVSLSKGGGALQGMGEKFSVNPATGTSSMSIPLSVSPARGLEPSLALSYSSGGGNGPFGFGWSLSLGSINRKTSQGIPRYEDGNESDVFVFSGAEDLVPILGEDGMFWEDSTSLPGYVIRRYRPRIEGLFSRIERCSSITKPGDVFWRTLDAANQLTIYGNTSESRIYDSKDPRRIFEWLMAESRDQKGNVAWFRYKNDDGLGVDLSRPHEQHRGPASDPGRTVNRYLKTILYGNRTPMLDSGGNRPHTLDRNILKNTSWLFEVTFDYGEHDNASPSPRDSGDWTFRSDPLSSYRSGFEIRTTRLCRRVLMFHHFKDEADFGENYLVKSVDFKYSQPSNPHDATYNFITSVTQNGYRQRNGSVLKVGTPAVEFEYSKPELSTFSEIADAESVENLPNGLSGGNTQWIDLFGEGLPGALTQYKSAWYYKRNLTPLNESPHEKGATKFSLAPMETLRVAPNLQPGAPHFDFTGNGYPGFVAGVEQPVGFYKSTAEEGFQAFDPFQHTINHSLDGDVRYLDVDGDGKPELIIAGDQVNWWFSFREGGIGPAQSFGHWSPRLLFCNENEVIHLADISGDGLTDIVRIRNGDSCYWPNMGNGVFGDKIILDNSPYFDSADQFLSQKIVLADIDASGTSDIIYLHGNGPRLYFNQSGNGWSDARELEGYPPLSNSISVTVLDLHGDGTPSLVISSSLPSDARTPLKYQKIMKFKPHLMTKCVNNLGSSTTIKYVSSIKFYLKDKSSGNPWITRLPFPIHVVESSITEDAISKNRFTSRMAYHHGFFDGDDAEFRGFGMVESWDSEEFASLNADGTFVNEDSKTQLPPTYTKSWFHLGDYLRSDNISRHYEHEYWREPSNTTGGFQKWFLPDTILPAALEVDERHDACRALKGILLRSEMYTNDAEPGDPDNVVLKSKTPHTVTEASYQVKLVQQKGSNRYPVFHTVQSQSLMSNIDRSSSDPRVTHTVVLQANDFGQILKQLTISYGRKSPDFSLPTLWDRTQQTESKIVYVESEPTNAIDDPVRYPFAYRLPSMCEVKSFELTGFVSDVSDGPFSLDYWINGDLKVIRDAEELRYEAIPDPKMKQKRLLSCHRTLFRKEDLSDLLPLYTNGPSSFGGETYKLAFTKSILETSLRKDGMLLMTDPDSLLLGTGPNEGGYRSGESLTASALFPTDLNIGTYWSPSGRAYFSTDAIPAQELDFARHNFFLPRLYRDPLGVESSVVFDDYNLLVVDSIDAIGNRVTVGDRSQDGTRVGNGMDFRVLQPFLVTDVNRNRAQVKFDALGRVVARASMGKIEEGVGDSVEGIVEDLDPTEIVVYLANPMKGSEALLMSASSRVVSDDFAYQRTKNDPSPTPVRVLAMQRTQLASSDRPNSITRVIAYSDGLGRVIQSKSQCKPGPVPSRDSAGQIILDKENQPMMTTEDRDPRWAAEGWKIFNNKGSPVRVYEPFFSDSHNFEFGVQIGVSPVVFYDSTGKVCATLQPNGTYSKAVYNTWSCISWDSGDTVLLDPRVDPDIQKYTASYFSSRPDFKTWYQLRVSGTLGTDEREAATKSAAYADSPSTTYFDSLGRPFLSKVDHRVACRGHELDGANDEFYTRAEINIEGNKTVIRDESVLFGGPMGRIIAKHEYDMLGGSLHDISSEKGESWTLRNIKGDPMRVWDSQGQLVRSEYDLAGRPIRTFVRQQGSGAQPPSEEKMVTRLVYGDYHPEAEQRNLRNSVYISLDQSGAASIDRCDFKGNVLQNSTRLCREYRNQIDWSSVDRTIPISITEVLNLTSLETELAAVVEDETFLSGGTYDALGRPMSMQLPHSGDTQITTVRMTYEVSSLTAIDCNIRGEQSAEGAPIWTKFVTELSYDAKGQRKRIVYGNDVSTEYEYSNVAQLVKAITRRSNDSASNKIQDLSYVYDPVWNMSTVSDKAQQIHFFRNNIVKPASKYTYDSLYRLIEATGREHLGQANGAPTAYTHNDSNRFDGLPGQENAMGKYKELYVYDEVGNFKKMIHQSSDNPSRGWTRKYTYDEPSRIEPQKKSDRLTSTSTGNGQEIYKYDLHGNMTRMPHFGGNSGEENMKYDFMDRLKEINLGGGGTAYYTYNQTGKRVRKVIERGPNLIEERIYLGDFEIFRRRSSTKLLLERETIHIHDDHRRIAIVESRTEGSATNDQAPAQLIRYQLTDHLQSSALEVDRTARILSYEEYSPYGSTTYQAMTTTLETPKRYRYTGKERDEESGLSYHGARYLAVWLGRWLTNDPGGLGDGSNLYAYVGDNPIKMNDPSGLAKRPAAPANDRWMLGIDEMWSAGVEGINKTERYAEGFWRATAAENRQFLWRPENSRKGSAEPSAPFESPGPATSVTEAGHDVTKKSWAHSEELTAVLKEAVDALGGKPENWTWKNYKDKINEIVSGKLRNGGEGTPGGQVRNSIIREGGGLEIGNADHEQNGLWSNRRPDRATAPPLPDKFPEPLAAAPARKVGTMPPPPEPAPVTPEVTPEPLKPVETTPIEKPPASAIESELKASGGKAGSIRGKINTGVAALGIAGTVGSIIRDIDQGNLGSAAVTTGIVSGLTVAAKYASKLGVVGKRLPVVGWGLMAYGTYKNLSSEEAQGARDATKAFVGNYTDNKVVGAIAGGVAQLGTSIGKTVVLDTITDIKDGATTLAKWAHNIW